MNQQQISRADYLDIIFDQRNKAYGGYILRKTYDRRMKKAGLFVLLGVTTFLSFSFAILNRKEKDSVRELQRPIVMTVTTLPPPPKQPEVMPPKPTTTPPPAPATKPFTPPVITDEPITPDKQMSSIKDLGKSEPGTGNQKGDSTAEGSGITGGTGTTTDIPVKPPMPQQPLVFVEQMPQFQGDLNSYLSKNMVYPEAARSAGIEGKVGIKFVINEDGSISDLKVLRSLGGGCDQEALRVIKSMPRWKPGKNNGVPVKVYFTQPITFKLQ